MSLQILCMIHRMILFQWLNFLLQNQKVKILVLLNKTNQMPRFSDPRIASQGNIWRSTVLTYLAKFKIVKISHANLKIEACMTRIHAQVIHANSFLARTMLQAISLMIPCTPRTHAHPIHASSYHARIIPRIWMMEFILLAVKWIQGWEISTTTETIPRPQGSQELVLIHLWIGPEILVFLMSSG